METKSPDLRGCVSGDDQTSSRDESVPVWDAGFPVYFPPGTSMDIGAAVSAARTSFQYRACAGRRRPLLPCSPMGAGDFLCSGAPGFLPQRQKDFNPRFLRALLFRRNEPLSVCRLHAFSSRETVSVMGEGASGVRG